jgi:hypothetical protein
MIRWSLYDIDYRFRQLRSERKLHELTKQVENVVNMYSKLKRR